MKKILICFGTRPEAIKMAPIVQEMKDKGLPFKICVTAQHREMLDQVLSFFKIVPDFDLNLMSADQTLNQLSSKIISGMDEVLSTFKPDLILVHGDTTTSVLVALAAFHNGIKIGHVEAGLRTFNLRSPFPEEMNRQLTGRLSDYHFAPTKAAKENLIKENIPSENIIVTGNTVVDALNLGMGRIHEIKKDEIAKCISLSRESLQKFILVTGHRRESFGPGFDQLCEALLELSDSEKIDIIYPVHPNPNVRAVVNKKLSNNQRVHLINPVTYPVMLWLIKNCEFIISDSGGIQEEAPSFGKKVLVTREVSERMEAVVAGTSILVGTDANRIVQQAKELINSSNPEIPNNPFGDGKASSRIVDFLIQKT